MLEHIPVYDTPAKLTAATALAQRKQHDVLRKICRVYDWKLEECELSSRLKDYATDNQSALKAALEDSRVGKSLSAASLQAVIALSAPYLSKYGQMFFISQRAFDQCTKDHKVINRTTLKDKENYSRLCDENWDRYRTCDVMCSHITLELLISVRPFVKNDAEAFNLAGLTISRAVKAYENVFLEPTVRPSPFPIMNERQTQDWFHKVLNYDKALKVQLEKFYRERTHQR